MIDLNNFNREQRKVVEDVITGGVPPQYVHIIADVYKRQEQDYEPEYVR